MRVRIVSCTVLAAVLMLWPAVALAQPAPEAGGETFVDVPPAAGPAGAVGACGYPLWPGVAGGGGALGAPVVNALGDAPTDTGVNPDNASQLDISQVSGTILHGEGTLLLVQQPVLPDAGTANPGETPAQNRAVIQLPHDCSAASFTVGQQITAIGIPTASGILDAETIQAG